MKNHIDDKGNYINSENLSLGQIYEKGFNAGYKSGVEAAKENGTSISEITDNAFNKIMRGGL